MYTVGAYTDQELINLINLFAEKDQFALHACTEVEPRGIVEDDILTGISRRITPIILDGLLELTGTLKPLYRAICPPSTIWGF